MVFKVPTLARTSDIGVINTNSASYSSPHSTVRSFLSSSKLAPVYNLTVLNYLGLYLSWIYLLTLVSFYPFFSILYIINLSLTSVLSLQPMSIRTLRLARGNLNILKPWNMPLWPTYLEHIPIGWHPLVCKLEQTRSRSRALCDQKLLHILLNFIYNLWSVSVRISVLLVHIGSNYASRPYGIQVSRFSYFKFPGFILCGTFSVSISI